MEQLTKKQVERFRKYATAAEPYAPDSKEATCYDAERIPGFDGKRLASLRAREILAEHGIPIEPQEGEQFPDDEDTTE